MKKTDMGELSGTLEGVILLTGKLGALEVGVRVAGQEFFKRFWNNQEISSKKIPTSLNDVTFSTEERNYKRDFAEEHSSHIGEVVNIKFRKVRVGLIHYLVDQLHGPKYPKKYMEILELSYQK